MIAMIFVFPLLLAGAFVLWYFIDQWYRSELVGDFDSKYVFITGSDTGFGHLLSLKLDAMGFHVFAGCYTSTGEDNLAKKASKNLIALPLDVTDKKSIANAREIIEKHLPVGKGLWGVVNNAGVVGEVTFDFCNVGDYRSVMEVNFFGPLAVTEAFMKLVKMERGRISTVTSILGRCSLAMVPYTCTKFALEPYCDGLRRAMKTFGVHSSIIAPGFHSTTQFAEIAALYGSVDRRWQNLSQDVKGEYGEEYFNAAKSFLGYTLKMLPFAFMNDPVNVADVMVHSLTSRRPKSRYLVGYDARFIVLLCAIVPDFISDQIIRYLLRYSLVRNAHQS